MKKRFVASMDLTYKYKLLIFHENYLLILIVYDAIKHPLDVELDLTLKTLLKQYACRSFYVHVHRLRVQCSRIGGVDDHNF